MKLNLRNSVLSVFGICVIISLTLHSLVVHPTRIIEDLFSQTAKHIPDSIEVSMHSMTDESDPLIFKPISPPESIKLPSPTPSDPKATPEPEASPEPEEAPDTMMAKQSGNILEKSDDGTIISKHGFYGIGVHNSGFDYIISYNGVQYSATRIMDVIAGNPAAKIGLKVGDIIFQVNGQQISFENDIIAQSASEIRLTIFRGGRFITFTFMREWISLDE